MSGCPEVKSLAAGASVPVQGIVQICGDAFQPAGCLGRELGQPVYASQPVYATHAVRPPHLFEQRLGARLAVLVADRQEVGAARTAEDLLR